MGFEILSVKEWQTLERMKRNGLVSLLDDSNVKELFHKQFENLVVSPGDLAETMMRRFKFVPMSYFDLRESLTTLNIYQLKKLVNKRRLYVLRTGQITQDLYVP